MCNLMQDAALKVALHDGKADKHAQVAAKPRLTDQLHRDSIMTARSAHDQTYQVTQPKWLILHLTWITNLELILPERAIAILSRI